MAPLPSPPLELRAASTSLPLAPLCAGKSTLQTAPRLERGSSEQLPGWLALTWRPGCSGDISASKGQALRACEAAAPQGAAPRLLGDGAGGLWAVPTVVTEPPPDSVKGQNDTSPQRRKAPPSSTAAIAAFTPLRGTRRAGGHVGARQWEGAAPHVWHPHLGVSGGL